MVERAAETYCKPTLTRALKAAICSRPTPSTTGQSSRYGHFNWPRQAATAARMAAPSTMHAAAKAIGGMYCSPYFMMGQLAPGG